MVTLGGGVKPKGENGPGVEAGGEQICPQQLAQKHPGLCGAWGSAARADFFWDRELLGPSFALQPQVPQGGARRGDAAARGPQAQRRPAHLLRHPLPQAAHARQENAPEERAALLANKALPPALRTRDFHQDPGSSWLCGDGAAASSAAAGSQRGFLGGTGAPGSALAGCWGLVLAGKRSGTGQRSPHGWHRAGLELRDRRKLFGDSGSPLLTAQKPPSGEHAGCTHGLAHSQAEQGRSWVLFGDVLPQRQLFLQRTPSRPDIGRRGPR